MAAFPSQQPLQHNELDNYLKANSFSATPNYVRQLAEGLPAPPLSLSSALCECKF